MNNELKDFKISKSERVSEDQVWFKAGEFTKLVEIKKEKYSILDKIKRFFRLRIIRNSEIVNCRSCDKEFLRDRLEKRTHVYKHLVSEEAKRKSKENIFSNLYLSNSLVFLDEVRLELLDLICPICKRPLLTLMVTFYNYYSYESRKNDL